MAGNSVPCLGRQDELCLCDMCLDRKVHLLREAPPDVQRSILAHLPPDNLDPIPPAVPSRMLSYNNLNAFLGEAEPRSPAGSSPSAPTAATSGGMRTSLADGATCATGSRQHLHMLSLFKVPLWPTHSDAEFDEVRAAPRNPPSVFSDIVIPPLVQQHIPTIKDCISYVMANANITGPRKEAAIVEAIDEILLICERQLMKEATH